MSRSLTTALFCFVSLLCTAARGSNVATELLPKGRPFRLTFVDPREIRMGLAFDGNSRIDANIGNYFSILALRPSEPQALPWVVHMGIEGAAFFSMHQQDGRFPLETTDGLIGAYTEGSLGRTQLQLRYTHISAHLADGSSDSPIAFSREFLTLRAGYILSNDLNVYLGVSRLTNSVPNLPPWSFQGGAIYFMSFGSTSLVPFTGFDLKWIQESDYNPSFAAQLGFALNNPPEAYRSFRFYYAYFTGADPHGQFYNRTYTTHSLGIEMQI